MILNWNSDANPIALGLNSGFNELFGTEPDEREKVLERKFNIHKRLAIAFYIVALIGFVVAVAGIDA